MIKTVIKRDGSKKTFDREKIYNAIMLAMKNGSGIVNEGVARHISNSSEFHFDNEVTIYQIEDYVFDELVRLGESLTAKAYNAYKVARTVRRNKNSELYEEFKEVLDCEDIKNANANVDEYSFGGRKFESASILHKKIALDELPDDVSRSHIENIVYQHDLDSYTTGMHNCLNINLPKLLAEGFHTRNGDCRPANSINTAMQLVAVIFQIQSQEQFGGVGSIHIDFDLAPYVRKSFKKHLKKALKRSKLNDSLVRLILNQKEYIRPHNEYKVEFKELFPNSTTAIKEFEQAWDYAIEDLNDEGRQSAQAMYHNLNTLESRPGSQVPFTSINFGRDTSCEGRLVSHWILDASIEGIGKFKRTSIFPISIFQYKKGVNDKAGTPNYDLYQRATSSISQRIYPNIVNCDWSQNIETPDNPDTYMSTINC